MNQYALSNLAFVGILGRLTNGLHIDGRGIFFYYPSFVKDIYTVRTVNKYPLVTGYTEWAIQLISSYFKRPKPHKKHSIISYIL